jgi:hypothetical protein
MLNGDISNAAPKRVLINADVLLIKYTKVKKKFKIFSSFEEELVFDRFLLNKFYLYSSRQGVTLELVSFEYKLDKLELMYNELDRAGLNPFRGFSYYSSPRKLAAELAYRPEVIGVIDPEHQLMYGKWGLDF